MQSKMENETNILIKYTPLTVTLLDLPNEMPTSGFFCVALLASATAQTELCTNTCNVKQDGACDDGGPGSEYSQCAYGTDCEDCGARPLALAPLPPSPWSPGLTPSPSPPAVPPGACKTDEVLVAAISLFFLGAILVLAAMNVPSAHPKFYARSMLFLLCSLPALGMAAAFLSPAVAQVLLGIEQGQCTSNDPTGAVVGMGTSLAMLPCMALAWRRKVLKDIQDIRARIETIEGDLPLRLADGSLRLLRVAWLLQQPADWILQRRQDLPDEAFWSPADAVRLLREGKVAALSYRWIEQLHSDPNRFHLDQVLEYFCSGSNARAHTALMIDFCSLPQKHPQTGAERSKELTFPLVWLNMGVTRPSQDPPEEPPIEELSNELLRARLSGQRCVTFTQEEWASFGIDRLHSNHFIEAPGVSAPSAFYQPMTEARIMKIGLGVMSCVYGSPRVLVLQHKRLPPDRERELNEAFGGVAPADRPDLIPYAGKHCRSGWCTSESACAMLTTARGGHAYELGVGKVPVAYGRLPSVKEMEALFQHESTRFIGRADRDVVSKGYLDLRAKLEAYDEEQVPLLMRAVDQIWTSSDSVHAFGRVLFFGVIPMGLIGSGIQASVDTEWVILLLVPLMSIFYTTFIIPSRIVGAYLAYLFGCRSRDSLEYSFHCSLCKPPFRKRTASLPTASGEFEVPACFLPRVIDRSPSSFLSFASSASLSKIPTETEVAASGPRPVEC